MRLRRAMRQRLPLQCQSRLRVGKHHLERPEEIADTWLADANVVGVTAGASTPDDIIESVVAALTAHGYAAPEGGILPGPDSVPAY